MVAVLNDQNKKVEESNLNLGDMEFGKRRITADNADLLCVLQRNANLLLPSLNRFKTKVASLDEMKYIADSEAKERVGLFGKFRNLEHNVMALKKTLMKSQEAMRMFVVCYQKVLGDADMYQ